MIYRVSAEERRTYFFYLLIMFIIMTAIIGWLLMSDIFKMNLSKTKEEYTKIVHVQRDYNKQQQQIVPIIDSLYGKISTYNAAVNALYVENEINDQINEIRTHAKTGKGAAHTAFTQLGDFYNEFFLTKKELGNMQKGIDEIKRNLQRAQPR